MQVRSAGLQGERRRGFKPDAVSGLEGSDTVKWRLKPCTETLQEPFRSRNVGGGANRSDRA